MGVNDYQDIQSLLKGFRWGTFSLISFLAWTAISLLLGFKYSVYLLSTDRNVDWPHLLLYNFNAALIWSMLTPLALWYTNKLFQIQAKWTKFILVHLVIMLPLLPLHSYLYLVWDYSTQNWLGLWGNHMDFPEYVSDYFFELLVEAFITYSILVALLTGYLLYLRNQHISKLQMKLEKNLVQTRIQNLKYQLQPHFLFNGMQTISNLIQKDTKLADKAITDLSDILRFSINQLNHDYISVQKEVDITKKYLEFQKLRFGKGVTYSINQNREGGDLKVPALLLQPLAENSVKHGFERTGRPIDIRIQITASDEVLTFEVTDNGPGFASVEDPYEGTGLKNLKNRLGYFYGDAYKMTITNMTEGAKVRVDIPKRKGG